MGKARENHEYFQSENIISGLKLEHGPPTYEAEYIPPNRDVW
jgi:hypothetical protein